MEDARDLAIGEILILPQQDNFAKLDWELLDGGAYLLNLQFTHVKIVRIFGWFDDVIGDDFVAVDGDHGRTIAALP